MGLLPGILLVVEEICEVEGGIILGVMLVIVGMTEVVGGLVDDVVVVVGIPRSHSKQRRILNNTSLEREHSTDSACVWQ